MDVDPPAPAPGPEGSDPAPRLSPVLPPVQEESPTSSVHPPPVPSEAAPYNAPPTPEASAAAATLAAVANSLPSAIAPAAADPAPSPVPAIPNPLPPGYNKDQPICANCSTQTTPLWRRSHDSTHILCNACALFFKMKGRPRPISLKTDVIKSRNRSKGKSTSKDRAGVTAPASKGNKERSESTNRSQEEGKNGRKSAPGGSEMDEDELDGDPYSKDSKMRRVAPPPGPYPGPWPYAAYPHPHAHPHAHQPYPPPRSRSRSSSSSRRAQSLDARPSGPPGPPMGNPYAYPPPGAHYAPPEGYPYYPPYPPYGGYPSPYYPPGQAYGPPGGPGGAHAHSAAAAAAHALVHPPTSITHAQSDSRSRSDSPSGEKGEKGASPRNSPSPPHYPSGLAQYYPHPNPNYPHQPPHSSQHAPYHQSPLSHGTSHAPPAGGHASSSLHKSGANGLPPNASSSVRDDPRTLEQPNGRVTLAPIHFGPGAGPVVSRSSTPTTPAGTDERVSLPHIGSVATGQPLAPGQRSPASGAHPRHSSLFASRLPSNATANGGESSSSKVTAGDRIRRTSVSSNSASISDSSDGVRSPDVGSRVPLPWGASASWASEDERRGRSERRYDDGEVGGGKGKGREEDEIDELDEDPVDGLHQHPGPLLPPLHAHPSSHHPNHDHLRMGGVDTGFGELRLGDQYANGSSPAPKDRTGASGPDSSRSRSSGTGTRDGRDGDQRGRSGSARGVAFRGRSQSTSRARASSRPTPTTAADAEIARLKTKVSELTFLNSLMQSRLGQLEGPGRVPLTPMSGLVSTPRPVVEDDEAMDEVGEDDVDAEGERESEDELTQFGVTVADPAMRASLLSFFRAQQAGTTA